MRLPIAVIVTLVLSCTVSEILQVFVLMTPHLFLPNFVGVPVGPVRRCWDQREYIQYLKLFGREIIFEVFPNLCDYDT